jgi:hypothetical protein
MRCFSSRDGPYRCPILRVIVYNKAGEMVEWKRSCEYADTSVFGGIFDAVDALRFYDISCKSAYSAGIHPYRKFVLL